MVSIPFFETNMCKFAIEMEMEMNFSITMGKNTPFLSEYFLIILSLHRNTYREKTRRITTYTNTYKHLNKNELRESKSFVMFCRMVSIESKAVILEFIFIKKFLLQFFFSQVKKVCQAHRAHLETVAIAVSLLLSLTNSLYCAFNEERWVLFFWAVNTFINRYLHQYLIGLWK